MQRIIKGIEMKKGSNDKVYALVSFSDHDDIRQAGCWVEDVYKALYDFYGKSVDLIIDTVNKNGKIYHTIQKLGTEVAPMPNPHPDQQPPPAIHTPPPAKQDDKAYWEAKNNRDNANIRRQVAFKGAIEIVAKNLQPGQEAMDIIVSEIEMLTDKFTTILEGTK